MDWNWLWVAGELALSYAFYRSWKTDDNLLAVLKIAPNIDINDLKRLSSQNSIDYAIVHGLVRPIDNKTSSILNSQHVSHYRGVIQRISIDERKLGKFHFFLSETNKTVSNFIRHVPFRLVSSTGDFVRIERPLNFDSIEDELDVIFRHFEPRNRSPVEMLVDVFAGDLSIGLETREEMLLIDTPLTGVGHLQKQSDKLWYLVPHEKWGGFLTRLSREDIIANYRSRLKAFQILSICCAIAAGCTAGYLIYRFYRNRQIRYARLPPAPPPVDTTIATDPTRIRLRCMICLENEVLYSLQPCSHLGLCHTCAENLQERSQGQELCPLCRSPIERYQRVFLP